MKYSKLIMSLWFFCSLYCCEGNSQGDSKLLHDETNSQLVDSIPIQTELKEEQIDSLVEFRRENNGEYIIEFKNTTNTREKYFYVLSEQNPYNKMPFKVLHTIPGGAKLYEIKNSSEIHIDYLSPEHLFEKRNPKYIESFSVINTRKKKYIAPSFNLFIYDKDSDPIGCRGYANILNYNGELLQSFEHLEVDIREPLVTDNGKYLVFVYGGVLNEKGAFLSEEGYRIYDIKSKKLILNRKSTEYEKFYAPIEYGNKIIIESNVNFYRSSRKIKFTIIDIDKNKIFVKTYDEETRDKLLEINENYLVFFDEKLNSKRFEYYHNDFNIEKL